MDSDSPRHTTALSVFPTGGGAVGELMRAHDWSSLPLGHPDSWSQSLRSVVDLMLNSKFPMFVAWGEDLGFLYNDSYTAVLGEKHPKALGRRFYDIWSEIWSDISPLIDAALAGEATYREDLPLTMNRRGFDEETWFTFSYSPVRDETGAVAGMFCACTETTAQVLAGRNQAFRAELEQQLRGLSDPREIMSTATAMLGRHLEAQRVGYGEVQTDDATVVLTACYANGVEPLTGAYTLDDFGPASMKQQRQGVVAFSNDLAIDPSQNPKVWTAIETRAFASVPLVRSDRFVASLYVNFRDPHRWTDDELSLIEEVAARTWSAVERARAEEALREGEERFRTLVEATAAVVWTTNGDGAIVADNPSWQKFTGQSRDEYGGWGWLDAIHSDDRDYVTGVWRSALANLSAYQCEYKLRRADGEYRWTVARGTPILGEDGSLREWIGANHDITDERHSASALQESEARFRNMADHAPVAMWVTDPTGYCTYLNRAWYEFTGQTPEQAEGFGWLDATHPDDREMAESAFLEANSERATFRIEYRLRHASGYRWTIDAAAPRFGADGVFLGYVGSVIDIDERRESEERLRALNADLERRVIQQTHERGKLWQISPDMLSVIDLKSGSFDTVNPAWEATVGWPAGQMESQPFGKFIHVDDEKAFEAAFGQVDADPVLRLESRFRTTDDEWRWLSWVALPEGGKLYATARDVTTEKERAAELRLHRNIVESDTSPVVAFDHELRVTAFNKAHENSFFELFGLRQKMGDKLPDQFPPDQAEALSAIMKRALGGDSFTVVETFGPSDQKKSTFEVSYHPLRGEDGTIIGAFHQAKDISDRLRTEAELVEVQEALRQSQKLEAMGQLTGGVAHDFNNLLTPIIGGLDMLQRKGIGDERTQRQIDGALQSAERAKTLVQRLLAFARRQPLQPTAVDVGELIDGMAELIGSTLGPSIDLRIVMEEALPPARADGNQLEMALLNLAVNARDAMANGGMLTIGASLEAVSVDREPFLTPGNYVRLKVADTGSGMDEETRKRAIEPFFSTKGIGRGTGLGLSMVHGLTSQLGGGLHVESAVGEGTAIEMWLPVSEAKAVQTLASEPTASLQKGRGTVLLVDDEILVRMGTAALLEDLGYEVVEANSAESALQQLSEGVEPDILLTDHLMPGMNGAELITAVRQSRPTLPVVIVSGYSDVEGVPADIPRLSKPFRNAELADCLAALA